MSNQDTEKLPLVAKVVIGVLLVCVCVSIHSCYKNARATADNPNVGVAFEQKRRDLMNCDGEYNTPKCYQDRMDRKAQAYEKDKHLRDL